VGADEGGENLRDGSPVRFGVLCDPLQTEDAADPDIELVAAELVDGTLGASARRQIAE
jgi:hypothetical protein